MENPIAPLFHPTRSQGSVSHPDGKTWNQQGGLFWEFSWRSRFFGLKILRKPDFDPK
jgi:hypothetical protein